MSPEEIVDLKLRLTQDHELLEGVAEVFAREGVLGHSKWDTFTPEQKVDWAIYYSVQATVVLTELISLPDDEWKSGYIPPEEYAAEIPLQAALIKMYQVPNEYIELIHNPDSEGLPDEWRSWVNGLKPNPLLTTSEVELLKNSGYDVLRN